MIRVYDHASPVEPAWLQAFAERALVECLQSAKPEADLPRLEEIEATIVDDATIARVHADFLADASPTDVITFQHGEILLSRDTAERQAGEAGHSPERELALYLVHGLLHLAGYDDHAPRDREEMHALQERIVQALWLR